MSQGSSDVNGEPKEPFFGLKNDLPDFSRPPAEEVNPKF